MQVNNKDNQELVLNITNLNKTFGGSQVLYNISMSLFARERLVVLGPSGCGKSVLLRCIAGLDLPDKGSQVILFQDSTNISHTPIIQREKFTSVFSMLFQSDALFDSMTVFQNIAFPLQYKLKMRNKTEIEELVLKELDAVELDKSSLDKYPNEISGGMKKRVAIARAIITKPKIVFFDEPTAGLDPLTATKISKLISKLNESTDASMIVVTHDKHCLSQIAKRAIVIENGAISYTGSVEDLMHKGTGNEFLSAFFN